MKSVLTYREQPPNYFDPGDIVLGGFDLVLNRVGPEDLFDLAIFVLECLFEVP
jgi:hypothetical protein